MATGDKHLLGVVVHVVVGLRLAAISTADLPPLLLRALGAFGQLAPSGALAFIALALGVLLLSLHLRKNSRL